MRFSAWRSKSKVPVAPPSRPTLTMRPRTLTAFMLALATLAETWSTMRSTPLPPVAASTASGQAGALESMARSAPNREECCPSHWDSAAGVVAPLSCTVQATPQTAGLDVALHEVTPPRSLHTIAVADLSELSPVLELNFTGATSGYRSARATSYSIWH